MSIILNMTTYPELEITPRCISCDSCRLMCPEKCIIKMGDRYVIETWACTMCFVCQSVCPVKCIKVTNTQEGVGIG
jgi:Pyruvate/2-oxoacid:ferredoxin oxidoreductase delta subunit